MKTFLAKLNSWYLRRKKRLNLYLQMLGKTQGLYLFARETFGDQRIITTSYQGKEISLRLNSSDIFVLDAVFGSRIYDIKLAKPPKVIIDAGAYTGLSAIFFAEKYSNATIFALEPEHSNFSLLRKNIKPYSNIVPINKALWDRNMAIKINERKTGSWGFTVSGPPEHVNDEALTVEAVTVDWIMKTHQIDYVDIFKIDIEGSEKEVFESSEDWINKVGVIAIELHDRIKDGCSRSFNEATKKFEHEIRRGDDILKIRDEYVF